MPYADDTIMYTAASLNQALLNLQIVFNVIQHSLLLKLVLNYKNNKYMIFSHTHSKKTDVAISTFDGTLIERVSSYKYLVNTFGRKTSF